MNAIGTIIVIGAMASLLAFFEITFEKVCRKTNLKKGVLYNVCNKLYIWMQQDLGEKYPNFDFRWMVFPVIGLLLFIFTVGVYINNAPTVITVFMVCIDCLFILLLCWVYILVIRFKSNRVEYLRCESCGNNYTLKDCQEDLKRTDFPFCPKCGGCPAGTKHIKLSPKIK